MTKEELHSKRTVALGELKYIEEALCLDEHYIDIIEQENAELKAEIENDRDLPTVAYMQGAENQKKKDEKQLTKAKEILQTILDKWKEERWILQSEKEVKQIENLMKQAEQFLKEI